MISSVAPSRPFAAILVIAPLSLAVRDNVAPSIAEANVTLRDELMFPTFSVTS